MKISRDQKNKLIDLFPNPKVERIKSASTRMAEFGSALLLDRGPKSKDITDKISTMDSTTLSEAKEILEDFREREITHGSRVCCFKSPTQGRLERAIRRVDKWLEKAATNDDSQTEEKGPS